MIGVWIGGFPSDLTRAALERRAAVEVQSRIGLALGKDAIKTRHRQ